MPRSKESVKCIKKFDVEKSSRNVFKDIGFSDDEANSLLARAQMMSALKDLIEESGMSQRQMAKVIGVQQPRIAEIVGIKTHLFSADLLMKFLSRMGQRVSVIVEAKNRVT